jgi:hypothetical protein
VHPSFEHDYVELNKMKQPVIRRIVDSRIWGSMTPAQQRSAERIAGGYSVLTNGLGMKGANYGGTGAGHDEDGSAGADLLIRLRKWQDRCAHERVDITGVIDVLIGGKSLARVDRETQKRRHTCRDNLFRALDLY